MTDKQQSKTQLTDQTELGKKKDNLALKSGLLAVGDGVLACGVLVALGAWLGSLLDEKLHTAPWLSLSLSIGGGIGGLARLVVNVQKLDQPGNER
jgi:F0F1-type ATP synthase assembly protein I